MGGKARESQICDPLVYLDDFLVIGTPNTSECPVALTKLLDLFHRLGLPVEMEKREGPATQLGFKRLREYDYPSLGQEAC